jgi:hypothetical protein
MPRRKQLTPREKRIKTLIDDLQYEKLTNADIEILKQMPKNTNKGKESGVTGDIFEISGFTYVMPEERHSLGRREPKFRKVKDGNIVHWVKADEDALKLCERHLPEDLMIEQSDIPNAGLAVKLKPGRKLGKGSLIGPFFGDPVTNPDAVADQSYLITNPGGQVCAN